MSKIEQLIKEKCPNGVEYKQIKDVFTLFSGMRGVSSKWADNGNDNITTSDIIYTPLNNFVEKISSNYRYIGEKGFGIGMYTSGSNFKDVQNDLLLANVGLPTVGEMFSGNDIDMTSPVDGAKIFVDVKIIENPNASAYYLTMNRFDSNFVCTSYHNGNNFFGDFTNNWGYYGVRPVIFLKNNLEFTGGDGTAQNPYTLE